MTTAEYCTTDGCDRPQAKHSSLCVEHTRIRALEDFQERLWRRLDGMQQALRVAAMSTDLEVRAVARESLINYGRWPMDYNPLHDGWDWRE
jgi:hypothetical protein